MSTTATRKHEMDSSQRREARLMTNFATKRHAEHVEREYWCRKCQTEALHEWARAEGLMPS